MAAEHAAGGASSSDQPAATWNSENDFPRVQLLPLEQLIQLLLCFERIDVCGLTNHV